jgi:hypothetical protein
VIDWVLITTHHADVFGYHKKRKINLKEIWPL